MRPWEEVAENIIHTVTLVVVGLVLLEVGDERLSLLEVINFCVVVL